MSDLTITKTLENNTLTVVAEGRIDVNTTPKFSEEINASINDATTLILDFEKVSYISSSLLRVLLSMSKAMAVKSGELILRKPTDTVSEVLEITGFSEVLNIER